MTFYQFVVASAFVILSFASSITGKFSIDKVTFNFFDHIKVLSFESAVRGMHIPRFMKCASACLYIFFSLC